MKKIILALFTALAVLPLMAVEHIWNIKDGSGSKICKDSGSDPVDLVIRNPEKVVWAREDDRGWFLNYKGGRVEVAPGADINYPEGVIAELNFSVNLADVTKPWVCLFSRGVNYC